MPLGHAAQKRRANVRFILKDSEARELIDLIYEHSGIVLTRDKKSLISSRLHKRLRRWGCARSGNTCDYLQHPARAKPRIVAMIDEITTNKTEFFREHQHFDFLVSGILPDLAMSDWSIAEFLVRGLLDRRGAILPGHGAWRSISARPAISPFSPPTCPRRRCGPRIRRVYPNELGTSIPVALRQKYTLTGHGSQAGRFRIVPELRERVTFDYVNLIAPDWQVPDAMNVVFCRNVDDLFRSEDTGRNRRQIPATSQGRRIPVHRPFRNLERHRSRIWDSSRSGQLSMPCDSRVGMAGKQIRVLIVDDSARRAAGVVGNPAIRSRTSRSWGSPRIPISQPRRWKSEIPDVITLDVEMPRMDGLTFLEKIMSQHPIPVVMCSSLTDEGCATALRAMECGAVTIITKPKMGVKMFLEESRITICDAVKAAASVRPRRLAPRPRQPERKLSADVVLAKAANRSMIQTTERVTVIGASTGGTIAIADRADRVAGGCAGHRHRAAHAGEIHHLIRRVRSIGNARITVKEAENNDTVMRGTALIAPGNRHTLLKRSGARYYVEVRDGPLVCRHRPSVDVLFRSAARYAGSNAVGVIMTGMGDDGARGLLEMKEAKAKTLAQDRGELRRVRHAERGDQARRGRQDRAARRHRHRNPARLRLKEIADADHVTTQTEGAVAHRHRRRSAHWLRWPMPSRSLSLCWQP